MIKSAFRETNVTKKKVYQNCCSQYFETWPFLSLSNAKGDDMIYCKINMIVIVWFDMDRGAFFNCERHIATMHEIKSKVVKPCKTISSLFVQEQQQSDSLQEVILTAEIS